MVISVPQGCRVFVLDDTEDRLRWFREQIPGVRCAKTSAEAIEILAAAEFDVVFLDHDLHWLDAADVHRQHGNGKEVARFLRIRKFPGRIVIHSRNQEAVVLMRNLLPQATVAPFGEFEITFERQAAAQ